MTPAPLVLPGFDLCKGTTRAHAVRLAWALRRRLRSGAIASCRLTGRDVRGFHVRPWGPWDPDRGRGSALLFAVEARWCHLDRPDLPTMRVALDVDYARRLAGPL